MVYFRPLRRTSSDFFLFRLIEERRLIIDFIRSPGSLGPGVHTTLKEFKNATITCRIFCFRKSRPGKSRASPDPIVVENVFRPHENSKLALSNSFALDRRPNRRKEAVCVYKFLRESVDGQSGTNHDVTEHHQTRVPFHLPHYYTAIVCIFLFSIA